MPTLVVPFRGASGKSRLEPLGADARAALAVAMLADVVEAAAAAGRTFVVAPEPSARGVTHVRDPGRGQGAAVRVGLDAAVAAGAGAPFLVVNADLPCVLPDDLRGLAHEASRAPVALAAAADGTTNALAFASADLFEPLYGPGSAERFAALGPSRRVNAPNLIDDVDTADDLDRLAPRLGRHTRRVLSGLRAGAAA